MQRNINLFSIISIGITLMAAILTYTYSVRESTDNGFTNISLDSTGKVVEVSKAVQPKSKEADDEKRRKDKLFTTDESKFWAKAVFSLIFLLASLFVILSKKYDDETKKWAFSVLTLIAGVWLGTASS